MFYDLFSNYKDNNFSREFQEPPEVHLTKSIHTTSYVLCNTVLCGLTFPCPRDLCPRLGFL